MYIEIGIKMWRKSDHIIKKTIYIYRKVFVFPTEQKYVRFIYNKSILILFNNNVMGYFLNLFKYNNIYIYVSFFLIYTYVYTNNST